METFLKNINNDLERILPHIGNILSSNDQANNDNKKVISNIRKKLVEFRVRQKIYTKEEASIYEKVVAKFLEENEQKLNSNNGGPAHLFEDGLESEESEEEVVNEESQEN